MEEWGKGYRKQLCTYVGSRSVGRGGGNAKKHVGGGNTHNKMCSTIRSRLMPVTVDQAREGEELFLSNSMW